MSFKIIFLLLTFIFSSELWALECQWWQIKVKAATIPEHQREGSTISKHPRKEHCRERWEGADHYINQFKNDSILEWDNKGETFKKWSNAEIQTILELLPKFPPWAKIEEYRFRRVGKSIHQANPAASELRTKSIILYDKFFTDVNKLGVIGHEIAHFLFQNISPAEILNFSELSGWDVEVKNDKVYVIPPRKPLKSDSVISKEEDFTNYMELYISNSNKLKNINFKMYDFFQKRFPK